VLVAFLAGTLCGVGVTMRHPERSEGPGRAGGAPPPAQVPRYAPDDAPALRENVAAPAAAIHPQRNLFAYFVPPEPPVLRTIAVPAAVVAAQPRLPEPPRAAQPPSFTYRYIGTFGTRENAFAVFARDGEVVNARVGDAIEGGRFTLRRIGLESVDLGWGGPGDLRVGITH
jgi:hypothetical protein